MRAAPEPLAFAGTRLESGTHALRPLSFRTTVLIAALAFASSASPGRASDISILHSHSNGSERWPGFGLVRDANGYFYGTLLQGGPFDGGAVYRVRSDGSGYQVLHTFSGGTTDGRRPGAGLVIDGAGNLFGTTEEGGVAGLGTVFTMRTDGTAFRILHSFRGFIDPNDPDGRLPYARLVQDAEGTLYGTTDRGGTADNGIIFTVRADGTGWRVLHSFGSLGDGASGASSLNVDDVGNLYGTTYWDGSGNGTVFSIRTDGSAYRTIHRFGDVADDGRWPRESLIPGGPGLLVGTASYGGLSDNGIVFAVKTDGSEYRILHHFGGFPAGGSHPSGPLLIDGSGTLFGATCNGGPRGIGTVFALGGDGSAFAILRAFDVSDGACPASVVPGESGRLLGVAGSGGANESGTLFSLGTSGQGFTVLRAFGDAFADGSYPTAGLRLDAGTGLLYGTTSQGRPGENSCGTVFRLRTDGSGYQMLHSFRGWMDGCNPMSLALGAQGQLFGTTKPQSQDAGKVFSLGQDGGGFRILHTFSGGESDGGGPETGLLLDSAGFLYGTAAIGGKGFGTVYRLGSFGTGFKLLHSFAGPPTDGNSPEGILVRDDAGFLYGITAFGGASDHGTVFRVKSDGSGYKVLYSFLRDAADGQYPIDGLVLDASGTLYGTTPFGGPPVDCNYYGAGTVFSIRTDGSGYRVLHQFMGGEDDGCGPESQLMLDASGYLYGTTAGGGRHGLGTVFKVRTDGSGFQLRHSFAGSPADGELPGGTLAIDGEGFLYGTTIRGGASNRGTEYRIATSCAPPAPAITLTSGTNPTCVGSSVTLDAGGGYDAYAWSTGETTRSISVSPAATTSYSVTAKRAECPESSRTTTVTLAVGSLIPEVPAPSNDGPACEGESLRLHLDALPGTTYSWTGPGGFTSTETQPTLVNLTAAMGGVYTVVATREGCSSAAGQTAVVVSPRPAAPVIAAPLAARSGEGGLTASVPSNPGSTYLWTITNGVVTSGQGSDRVTFQAGGLGTLVLRAVEVNASGCASANAAAVVDVSGPGIRSIVPNSGVVTGGTPVTLRGEGFAPGTTLAIGESAALSVTIVDPTTITAVTPEHPAGVADVVATTPAGAALPLFRAFAFVPPHAATSFYTLTPCRTVDTRNPAGPQGGPALPAGGRERVFPIAGTCDVPFDAKAVSLNVTVADATAGGFLRFSPGDGIPSGATAIEFQPGKNRANNAMVYLATDGSGGFLVRNEAPEGDTVHFIVDVNGYFK